MNAPRCWDHLKLINRVKGEIKEWERERVHKAKNNRKGLPIVEQA